MRPPPPHPRADATEQVRVTLTVNGSEVTLSLPARVTLSDALRDHLGLTGTHVGCEHGICGMCTVLVDGEAARACLLLAVQLEGAEIITVEGLGRPGQLHPLQEAFGRHHGLQCGFCTPGFLMSAYDLLRQRPDVRHEDLPAQLSGVLCRCTGYRNVVNAVHDVAQTHRHGIPEPGNLGRRTLVGRVPAGSAGTRGMEEQQQEPPLVSRPKEIVLPAGEPTIRVDVTSELNSSAEDVAQLFNDVPGLAKCLPGAELTDELGDDWYRGQARVALGPVRLAFTGVAHVMEQSSDRIVLHAHGKDIGGGGARASIVMSARPAGTGTVLSAQARVFLTGRVAGFGRSLAGDVSRRLFQDFAHAVDQVASGDQPTEETGRPPNLIAVVVAAVVGRVRRAIRKLRRR